MRPGVQDIDHEAPVGEIRLDKLHEALVFPQCLLMQAQVSLGEVAKTAVGRRRVGIDGVQRFREGADLPVFFEGVGKLLAHELLQVRHVEEVGEFVDVWMDGDCGFGIGFVVVLVDVGDDFVEDVGVHLFELDVLGVAFLRRGEMISSTESDSADGMVR